MAPPHTPSPGNAFGSGESSMRMPHLEFIYRVVAFMSPNNVVIPDIHSTGVARVILPISGGTVKGPLVNGVIVKDSGADWAQRIRGPRSSKPTTKLNARYTLKTDDGHFILVNAVGMFVRSRPDGNAKSPEQTSTSALTATQDDVEYFTHITFEAQDGSPYGWLNSAVAVGVMTMFEGKPIIDCYRLTNFPGRGVAHL